MNMALKMVPFKKKIAANKIPCMSFYHLSQAYLLEPSVCNNS